ncbi:MAG: phosphate acyltransferase PlsX [Candidatus Riflebacteria bacterium]|nr:phosphate acyltransferase PlsX [Candidatus Riflebacteria bacterium]
MKIALDIMGGDFAPKELLLGAEKFSQAESADLVLVGDGKAIKEFLPVLPPNCEVYETPEFIEMGESPTQALRKKKNSSVAVAARLVKEGKAGGFVSAGSTGAQMAASLLEIGRIPGIERPAAAVVFPTMTGKGVVILDVGANVDCKAHHLAHFALMGSAYDSCIFSVEKPRIGLLNVGSEAGKGNELAKAVFPLLEKSNLNFIGNVEGDHLFEGVADVVVCDGFVGNVLLKASEGASEAFRKALVDSLKATGVSPEIMKAILSGLKRYQVDSPEYSGAPLLGIAGVSIVCHGKSKAPVITNALHLAVQYASGNVIDQIFTNLAGYQSSTIS